MNEIQRKEIKEHLELCVRDGVFPGANVLVYEAGKASFFSVGKKRILPYEEDIDLSTLYDCASLSKVVSTINLVMIAIDEGRLSLETKVARVLIGYMHKDITVFDLCTHTSGLPAGVQIQCSDDKEAIRKIIYACDKTYKTGDEVVYSDIGFILLGFILEEVYQKSLQQLAKENIFQPLEMYDTMYCPDVERQKRCAPTEDSPHFHKLLCGEVHDRMAHLMKGVSGHAGVFTTIQDMAHFVEMLLHKGMYQGKRVLREECIQLFSKTMTPSGKIARSLGYLTKDERSPFAQQNSEQAFLHTGFSGTSILLDPKLELGIVILSNRIHPTRDNTKIYTARKEIHTTICKILEEFK